MTITNYCVNSDGMGELKTILETVSNHAHIDASCLNAYAADVEESLGAGNPAMFEIRGIHSKSGNPETFTISGFDAVEMDEE